MMTVIDKKIGNLYKSGLSVKQISDRLTLGYSSVRNSLDKQNIARRSISSAVKQINITKFGKKKCQIKRSLLQNEKELKIAGTMLYWGEGTKSGNSVVFTNSDPAMIKCFLDFLRSVCQVDEKRLRMLLHLYDGQDENSLVGYWSEITKIPVNQFSKTFFHKKKQGTYKKVSEFGTASLRYSDKDLLEIINSWIQQYKLPA